MKINEEYLFGVKLNDTAIVVWFNGQPYHAAPLAMNLVHNALVRAALGQDYRINVYNHPLSNGMKEQEISSYLYERAFGIGLSVSFWLMFVAASYIVSSIKVKLESKPFNYKIRIISLQFEQERTHQVNLMQSLHGLDAFIFWLLAFLWDLCICTITSALFIVTLAVFQFDNWSSSVALGRIFVVLFVYGVAMLPMTYVFSLFIKNPNYGMFVMTFVHFATGDFLLFPLCVLFVEINFQFYTGVMAYSFDTLTECNLQWMHWIFPQFALASSLYNLGLYQSIGWEKPGIGQNILIMFVTGFVYFVILAACECRTVQKLYFSVRNSSTKTADNNIDDRIIGNKPESRSNFAK